MFLPFVSRPDRFNFARNEFVSQVSMSDRSRLQLLAADLPRHTECAVATFAQFTGCSIYFTRRQERLAKYILPRVLEAAPSATLLY